MSATPLPELILYTRPGCELCDDARAIVQGLLEDRAARGQRVAALREWDLEGDPALESSLGPVVPVLEIRGRRLELATSPSKIRRFLGETLDDVLA